MPTPGGAIGLPPASSACRATIRPRTFRSGTSARWNCRRAIRERPASRRGSTPRGGGGRVPLKDRRRRGAHILHEGRRFDDDRVAAPAEDPPLDLDEAPEAQPELDALVEFDEFLGGMPAFLA